LKLPPVGARHEHRRISATLTLILMLTAYLVGWPVLAALQDDQPPPYIGTPPRVIDRMLSLAKVGSADFVMDLGSGDGRIVLEAARRFGARAEGIEMNGALVEKCQQAARREGLAERALCRQHDIFNTDLSAVTVLTLYLSPEFNEKLSSRILRTMRPGTRVVSHDFAVGQWTPDVVEQLYVPEKNFGRGGDSTIMLFTVPAQAAGRWRGAMGESSTRSDIEFSISQQFQMIEGAVHEGRQNRPFAKSMLRADRIELQLPDTAASGRAGVITARIEGDRMNGTFQPADRSATVPFSAQRIDTRPAVF